MKQAVNSREALYNVVDLKHGSYKVVLMLPPTASLGISYQKLSLAPKGASPHLKPLTRVKNSHKLEIQNFVRH